jgi:ribonuclease HI
VSQTLELYSTTIKMSIYQGLQSTGRGSAELVDRVGNSSIFCDGACRGNGTKRAVAGWAWAFWPGAAVGEPTHFGAAPLAGQPATNQRAELMALLEAMRWWASGEGGPIKIYTDSSYAISCTSKWGPSWRKKGWRRDSGEPLQNLDIIKPLVELWKPKWALVHVRGHQTGDRPEVWGNNWVDRAAVAGANGTEMIPVTGPPRLPHAELPSVARPLRSAEPPRTAEPPVEDSNELHPLMRPVRSAPVMPRDTRRVPVVQSDIRSWFAAGGGGMTTTD